MSATRAMFPEGFREQLVQTEEAEIYVRTGGVGPPLVCLHGYPQSHLTWRKVAPLLMDRYTLILPDLRGYGQSQVVPSDEAHLAYSKRAMARDIVSLMQKLGHDRFFLAGHDRGGRVAYRLALDSPRSVAAMATLDIAPTVETWEAMDYTRAFDAHHWLFLAQPEPLPERLIGADPEWYCSRQARNWSRKRTADDETALAAYCKAFARPGAVHAACEDYRAGYTCDLEFDRADRAIGKRIDPPLLVLWGAGQDGNRSAHLSALWKQWSNDLRTMPISSGHFMMEENPEETASALGAFFDTYRNHLW